jgi:hypothetical protein
VTVSQVPGLAFNIWPCWKVPEMVGWETFTGALTWFTTAVADDVAEVEPTLFVAVTRSRISDPASDDDNEYVCAVAPETSTQLEPATLHLSHW